MNYKWFGGILIFAACGGFGLHIAAGHHKAVQALTQLIRSLDFMECALQYQLTPLPILCEQAGRSVSGNIRRVYFGLAAELRSKTHADALSGMDQVLNRMEDLSRREKRLFRLLGSSLGRFDLSGQVRGLQNVREECSMELQKIKANQEERLRSYQTLGFCAGAALVILFY